MSLLRQTMILVLMPLTAWTGMPQLACQCSTGEIRLNCSRLISSARARSIEKTPADSNRSCCQRVAAVERVAKSTARSCCGTTKQSQASKQIGSTALECRCVAIVLTVASVPNAKFTCQIDSNPIGFVPRTIGLAQAMFTMRSISNPRDTGPPVSGDLIVFFERLLV